MRSLPAFSECNAVNRFKPGLSQFSYKRVLDVQLTGYARIAEVTRSITVQGELTQIISQSHWVEGEDEAHYASS